MLNNGPWTIDNGQWEIDNDYGAIPRLVELMMLVRSLRSSLLLLMIDSASAAARYPVSLKRRTSIPFRYNK
jgi:hypothetical protein